MYFPFRHGEGPNLPGERLKQLIHAMSGKPLRGFHLRFDVEMLHNEGLPLPPKIEDTLIAALLMNENEESFALKWSKTRGRGLAPKYLGEDSIKDDRVLAEKLQARGLGKGDMWKLPASEVADYACSDLTLPEQLMERIYTPALERWGITQLFADYNDYQRLLIEMEIGGLPVDRQVVDRALHDGEIASASLMDEIKGVAGYPLNPNSPKQVTAACGTPNAQAETLQRSGHPLARLISDFKTYNKRDSAYLRHFIGYADKTGQLHVQLNLTRDEREMGGTRSGRLSVSRPPLQGMPKPKTDPIYAPCREAIKAPPGYLIVEADYSQAEVRIAGHYSQEPELFAVFNEGIDIYEEFAAQVQHLVPGFQRQHAKILHLAIQYGAGAWKVAVMLGIHESDAYRLREEWHARFPRISMMMRRLQKIAERNGCIRLPEGRWAHFDGDRKSAHCKSPYYTAWNRLVQGSVAGMMRVAMMRLWAPMTALGGRMLLQVHDSILFLVPTAQLREACALIRHHMQDFPSWDIPARVDIKAGPSWLAVQEVKEAA